MGQHGKVQHSHYNHQKNGDFPSQAHLILIALHNSQRTFFVLNMGTITTQNTQERSSSCPHWKNSEYHRSFHLPCYLAISLCSLLPAFSRPPSICLSVFSAHLFMHSFVFSGIPAVRRISPREIWLCVSGVIINLSGPQGPPGTHTLPDRQKYSMFGLDHSLSPPILQSVSSWWR